MCKDSVDDDGGWVRAEPDGASLGLCKYRGSDRLKIMSGVKFRGRGTFWVLQVGDFSHLERVCKETVSA